MAFATARTAFVDLSEMRTLAGARKAKDTSVNVSPSRPSEFFVFNHHDRGPFGQNQTRSQLVERTACFLGCSRPFRKNADGMKEHQTSVRIGAFQCRL